ncbi:MAG: benzoate-CoA ligase family [Chloroflexi bacterium]|nr:benzoate-CoA ligase family [Chloroflexota bacterium]
MHAEITRVKIDYDVPDTFNMATILVDNHVDQGRGDRVAIYFGDEAITYRELQQRSNRAGNMLRARGTEIENRVVLLIADRPQFVETFLGTMKLGAVPVPINVISTPSEIAYFLDDSRAKAIVVDAAFAATVAGIAAERRYLKHVFVVGDEAIRPTSTVAYHSYDAEVAAASDKLETEPTSKDDQCYWLYSSGTTGQPKGVVHCHRDQVHCAGRWLEQVWQPMAEDITYSASKLAFSYGLGNSLWMPLMSCTAMVLVPDASSPQVVASTLKRYRPTTFYSVPTLYNMILRQQEAGTIDLDTSSLRMCVSAGEMLPAAIYQRWCDAFGIEILDGIGSTEDGNIYIQNMPGRVRAGSSGEIVDGYAVRILDENGQSVPDGETGELFLNSESMAWSYWRKRDRSRDTFRGDWMKTGDRYRRDPDGYYYYIGRADDVFKTGAQWVSPVEVEGVLLRHPAVAEVAIVGCDDTDGLTKPKAYVVLKPGNTGDDALVVALQDHSKAELAPDYYKYPRWIDFVTEIPKTATGKIQRYKLRG